MLDTPHVSGLSIARPDSKEGKSLNKELEKSAIYLHPNLRTDNPDDRPPYHRKFDFYSLGLTLLEVGMWNTIDHRVSSSLEPAEFKKRVIDRCAKDLPFFMGKRYCDAVLHCLNCADDKEDESASALETLYECVVLELAKC